MKPKHWYVIDFDVHPLLGSMALYEHEELGDETYCLLKIQNKYFRTNERDLRNAVQEWKLGYLEETTVE